ncbi:DUF6446 family protein [Paracoccus tegillarcae]|uniref:Histidine kinase n=1 Tax=Paracoccus tegillarcae TaxID=1529068 RepID=A0A2K9EVM6_9RHOB|nr:DUF6446 family protein [Paracoccus tegillarcae]AUH34956.1 histidine kinase [Paracoccus tegillarcae]
MNWGKVAIVSIFVAAIATGAGVWYAQEYGYYENIDPAGPDAIVTATSAADGEQTDLPVADFQGINGTSSPIRWRACFQLTEQPLPDSLTPYAGATPLNAPGWFDCFDAEQIGDDLASGAATAVLGQADIRPDVDRVLAIYPDGRAFGWHQYLDKTPERGVMD